MFESLLRSFLHFLGGRKLMNRIFFLFLSVSFLGFLVAAC